MTPGQQIGNYRIVRLLGAGGMGEVYLAQDTRLDRFVALKILAGDLAADEDRRQRFIREAKAASALNHPNVAVVYDIGEEAGVRFIVMEYIEGETLAERMRSRRLTSDEVMDFATQTASALAAAHAKGIIHRDIKPGNLMITPQGQLKVLDFGLAKLVTDSSSDTSGDMPTQAAGTATGLIVGTVQYMSPEQLLGRPLDGRTDIFSFGVVLHEMAQGGHPFETQQMDASVPVQLRQLIRKCLEKDRERRYSSATELLADLKNLPQPKRRPYLLAAVLFAVVVAGIIGGIAFFARSPDVGPAVESIAVLPLMNVGGNADTEYLADGLTDGIISNLSQLPGLRVMSRSSIQRFKGKSVDPQAAGRELKVDGVLSGRIVPQGDNMNIALELVDTRDNHAIWGEQFNEHLKDLLRVQAEIARQISEGLRLKLSGSQAQTEIAKRSPQNADAYDLYLKGRFYWNQGNEESIKTSIQYFNQSLEKDPKYALAYAGLADAYILLGTDTMAPRDAMPKARDYASKAMELNDSLPEAHASLGIIKMIYEWDWKTAEKELRHNLPLSQQSLEAFSCAAHYADPLGRNSEALTDIKRALELDPMSLISNTELGCASYYGHQYDQAVAQFYKTLKMDPNSALAYYGLGRALSAQDMYAEAISEMTKGAEVTNRWPPIIAELAYAKAKAGQKVEAQKLIRELNDARSQRYVDAALIASIYAGFDKKQALDWLEKAYDERSLYMVWLKVEPKWDPLRTDPRFAALLDQVGFGSQAQR